MTKKSAWLSPCRMHRYTLSRIWDESLPPLVVIGLNPSTADESQDDPTIRRCIAFAMREGRGSLVMLNLFSYRATSPKALKGIDPFRLTDDSANTRIVKEQVEKAHKAGGTILVAWGVHGELHGYGEFFKILLGAYPLTCLGHTAAGHPRHPLYIKADQPLEAWTPWKYQSHGWWAE